jgi:hypothetical protein
MTTKSPPSLEWLEDRITPTGVPWPDGQALTLSFLPDGTTAGKTTSDLFRLLNKQAPAATWEVAVMRAFQTWAAAANINIGLVADGGQPLGTSSTFQHDPRFGDIRVAAEKMATNTVALGTPFSYAGLAWSGSTLFNDGDAFSVNGGPGQYDLFTVALHEAGHALGLWDNLADPTSAMNPYYQGPITGLDAQDVASIQALYGPRKPDSYEGTTGNSSFAAASSLLNSKASWLLSADVTAPGEVDYYEITTPSNPDLSRLTVKVLTKGISMLVPVASIYNASEQLVGTAAAVNALGGNLTLSVPVKPSTTYYFAVKGATGDVFATGAYQFSFAYTSRSFRTTPQPAGPVFKFVNDFYTNESPAMATNLVTKNMSAGITTYSYGGKFLSSRDVDYYVLKTPATPGIADYTMTAGAWAASTGMNPAIHFFSADGTPLAAQVLADSAGSFILQLADAAPDTSYYVEVVPRAGSTTFPVNYTLEVEMDTSTPLSSAVLGSNTLKSGSSTNAATLTMNQNGLFDFELAAQTVNAASTPVVTLNVYDSIGNLVLTLSTASGGAPASAVVFLQAGIYTLDYSTSGPRAPVNYWLGGRLLSDGIGPYYTGDLTTGQSSDTTFTYNGADLTGGSSSTQYYY